MERAQHGVEGRLARALRRGDEAGLAALAAYAQPVYAFVLPRVAGDPQAAEDVTQETFLAALDALERFDGRASLTTWLCAIARHKVADHYRRQQRLERLRLALQSPPALEVGLLERLEREELCRWVVAVLRDLAPHYRQALLLKYVDGLTGRQLSAQLGLSEEATESLLVRARAAFREAFRDRDGTVRKEQRYGPA